MGTGLAELKELLEGVYYLIAVLGVPGAVYLFWNELRRQRLEREHEAYSSLGEKYSEYIRLCLEQPELDVFEWTDGGAPGDPAGQADTATRRERMMMTYLVTLFERAYLMYREQSPAFRRRQWSGWEAYIDQWCARPTFREAWRHYGQMFDTDFMAYLEGRVRRAEAAGGGVTGP